MQKFPSTLQDHLGKSMMNSVGHVDLDVSVVYYSSRAFDEHLMLMAPTNSPSLIDT